MGALSRDHAAQVDGTLAKLRDALVSGPEQVAAWKEIETGLEHLDPLLVALHVAEAALWKWLYIVCYLLSQGARADETFVGVASVIAEQVRGDLAGREFWDLFIHLGSRDQELGKELSSLFLDVRSPTAAAMAAMLIAGVSVGNPDWAMRETRGLLGSSETIRRQAGLRAIAKMIDRNSALASDFGKVVIALPIPSQIDETLALVSCLRALHASGIEGVEDRIMALFKEGSDEAKAIAMNEAAILPSFPVERMKELVDMCPPSESDWTKSALVDLLVRISTGDLAYVLERIHIVAQKELVWRTFGMNGETHLFQVIGATDRALAFETIDNWLNNPTPTLLLQIPGLMMDVFAREWGTLITKMQRWDLAETPRFRMRLETLLGIISADLREANPPTSLAVDDIFEIAGWLEIDVDEVSRGDRERTFRALRVINSLLYPMKPVDYDQLFKNLDKVPHVRDFFGIQWFETLRRTDEAEQLIPHMFDHAPPSDNEVKQAISDFGGETDLQRKMSRGMYVRHLIHLSRVFGYWDDIFSRLHLKEPGVGQLRRELRSGLDAGDALCEAEIASQLLRVCKVEIKPKVPGMRDLRVDLLGTRVILEVYNPRLPRELELASGARGMDIHRMKKKILEKYDRQLQPPDPATEGSVVAEPLVVVINTGGAVISEWDIDDMLHGTKKVELIFDTRAARAVAERLARERDAITQEEKGTAVISGVIAYERNLTDFAAPRLMVRYYPNPLSAKPLSTASVEQLCHSISPE